jgi:hypothetical protein
MGLRSYTIVYVSGCKHVLFGPVEITVGSRVEGVGGTSRLGDRMISSGLAGRVHF